MPILGALKNRAAELKQFTLVAYFAARDPLTPVHVRVLAFLVAAYALSPIDLIPDFIPVLGYLDDLVLVPLGLALVVRLLPPAALASACEQARRVSEQPTGKLVAGVIVAVWLLVLFFAGRWAWSSVVA